MRTYSIARYVSLVSVLMAPVLCDMGGCGGKHSTPSVHDSGTGNDATNDQDDGATRDGSSDAEVHGSLLKPVRSRLNGAPVRLVLEYDGSLGTSSSRRT